MHIKLESIHCTRIIFIKNIPPRVESLKIVLYTELKTQFKWKLNFMRMQLSPFSMKKIPHCVSSTGLLTLSVPTDLLDGLATKSAKQILLKMISVSIKLKKIFNIKDK